MDGPRLTPERSHKRGALVAFAVAADFAWVAVHIQTLAALGLVEGDPRFYLAYQIGRCTVTGIALAVALRSGLFGRRELGLIGARHGAALCRVAKLVGVVAPIAAAFVGGALLGAPGTACEVARRSLAVPVIYPWEMFVRDLLCMVVVAPVYEELMYRALLLSALRDRFGEQATLLIGGALFVLLHYLYGYGWHVGYMGMALVLGMIFLRTRSLVPALVLHVLNNLWVVLNWYTRDALGEAAILGWLCSPVPP